MEVVRTEEEIDEQLNKAQAIIDEGGSPFFGMSYEDGIVAMHEWLTGLHDDAPMDQ